MEYLKGIWWVYFVPDAIFDSYLPYQLYPNDPNEISEISQLYRRFWLLLAWGLATLRAPWKVGHWPALAGARGRKHPAMTTNKNGARNQTMHNHKPQWLWRREIEKFRITCSHTQLGCLLFLIESAFLARNHKTNKHGKEKAAKESTFKTPTNTKIVFSVFLIQGVQGARQ